MNTFQKDNGKFWYRPNVVRMSDFVVICPGALEDSIDDAFEQKQSLEIVSSSFGATTNHFREKPTILSCPYLNATETNGSDSKFYLFSSTESLFRPSLQSGDMWGRVVLGLD